MFFLRQAEANVEKEMRSKHLCLALKSWDSWKHNGALKKGASLVVKGIGDEILPSCAGIKQSHYKDPLLNNQQVFFLAQFVC